MKLLLGNAVRLAVVALVFAAGAASAQVTLWGALGTTATTSNLYTIDPASGAQVSSIGPIGYAITGLAVHPTTGVLYGSTTNNSTACPGCLITINKASGVGTVVGSFGFPGQTMADLTFTSDGVLYGWLEANADDLHTINLTTGAATIVGNAGISTFGSGLAANSANVLYYAGGGNREALRTINRTTGVPTTVVPNMSGGTSPNDSPIAALAFNGAVLYGVVIDFNVTTRPTRLVTINTTSGVITDLGASIDRLDAIAFDGVAPPPPAANLPVPVDSPFMLALLALLLATASLWKLRRR